MDVAMRSRLKIRKDKLQKTIAEAKETIQLFNTDGVDLKSICKLQHMLRNDNERLRDEIKGYIKTSKDVDQDLVSETTNEEIEAEDLLVELITLEKCIEWPKHSNSTSSSSTKLPKIVLPTFNGDLLNWYQFWDRFETTVHNSNLSEADKLAYLMGCLEGPALDKVTGISTTNINYKVALSILKERYGSKTKLIDSHYDAIHKLKKCSSSALDCRKMLDEIQKNMRILKELGEDTNGNQFRAIVIDKFPENVTYQVNLRTDIDDSTTNIIKSLEVVISALEKTDIKHNIKDIETNVEQGTTATLHTFADRKNKRNERDQNFTQRKNKFNFKSEGKRKAESSNGPPLKRNKPACIFCEGDHYNDNCNKVISLKDRKLKLSGRCYNCFRKGHEAKICRLKKKCVYCQKMHNRALCFKKINLAPITGEESFDITRDVENIETNCFINSYTGISYLQTAVVKVPANNTTQQCRLILDCGSQRSYITSKVTKQLNLIPDKEDQLLIYTFGSDKPEEKYSPSVRVTFLTKRNVKRTIRVNIVSHITDRLPVPNVVIPSQVDVKADDNSVGERIDMLIGNDYYFSFIRNNQICLQDNLYLIDTDFGWIVSGSTATTNDDNMLSIITYCQCHNTGCNYFTEPDLPLRNIDMKFLWTLESIGITDSPKATQQEQAVKHFNDTVEFRNSRYFVRWPWVQSPPDIPTNFGLAYGRLKSLLHRLDWETLQDYEEILKEQLDTGIIETIDPQQLLEESRQASTQPIHYLPHHIVKQEGKRGRVVYDASAKIKGHKSLNEAMYKGPSMLEDLTGLLLKFRTGRIGIAGDVEKAFLQVGLQEKDRDVTRFLWVKDHRKEPTIDNLKCTRHLRFCRVPFGIISSPFLLTASIRYHLSMNNQQLLNKIADRCYVDNLVTNSETVSEAVELFKETRKVFSEISMNIRDWVSNDQEFINTIPKKHRSKQQETVKLLGLTWNLIDDTLKLKINEDLFRKNQNVNVTKRDVLKTLARVYDPCGFAAPLVLPAKLLFQELCTQKLKWDSKLPEDMLKTWDSVCDSLQNAKDIKIPRYTGHKEVSKDSVKYDLHCFTDASKNAYAAVVYLVTYNQENKNIAFIMSKARITPVEDKDDLKIPRLELLGYLIGSRLLKYVKNSLQLDIANQYLWTDSLIVLNWMRSNKLLPPFVLRRVNEVKENSDVVNCYINTNQNPADLATRPELWHQKKDLWFNGPNFLKEKRDSWPQIIHTQTSEQAAFLLAGEALEVVDGPEMVMKGYEDSHDMTQQDTDDNCNETEYTDKTILDESVSAIKKLQTRYFSDEIARKMTHLTRNLGLFLDVDGVLRCRGRMMNTHWPYEQKYPALIPRDSTFTNELIRHIHETNYHIGAPHTLSVIRQKYWIPQGRAQVQKVIKKCPQCVKQSGGPYKLPPPPALPAERVNYSIPFTYTGIDYFGPLFVATASGKEKRWVCLFTCLAVRAIHLEVVENLKAEECLLAVRRFIASRGLPNMIVSDNSQTFKLTSEILSSPYCIQNKIHWKFIPQLAPWHGGFYERLIALVKHCLKRTLDKHLLYDNKLKTVIKEVEMVINTRPLTYVGAELDAVLRPADFLTLGKCLTIELSEEDILLGTNVKIDLLKSWKRGQKILDEFKKMFTDQYLVSLRERYNHSLKQQRVTVNRTPEIGDIVQIKDGSKNRSNWKVGKIVSLRKGEDDRCRVANVRVGDTELIRSIAHLYPLEDDVNPMVGHQADPPREIQLPPPPEVEDIGVSTEQEPMEVDQQSSCWQELSPEIIVDQHDKIYEDNPVDEVDNSTTVTTSPNNIENASMQLEFSEIREDQQQERDDDTSPHPENRLRRKAAIRARERIAEWTRQLFTHLQ